jgi:hypothetical protein
MSLEAKHRLAVMYSWSDFSGSGELMSHGVSLADLFRRAASYIEQNLKKKPGDCQRSSRRRLLQRRPVKQSRSVQNHEYWSNVHRAHSGRWDLKIAFDSYHIEFSLAIELGVGLIAR